MSEYGLKLLAGLNQLRQESVLCDVTIRVGNRYFEAHKVILAAASSYFKAMFVEDMLEAQVKEVELKEVGEEAFNDVLNYIYTGMIR